MNTKIATILTVLAVSGAAHAVMFNFQSNGTSSSRGTTVTVSNPT